MPVSDKSHQDGLRASAAARGVPSGDLSEEDLAAASGADAAVTTGLGGVAATAGVIAASDPEPVTKAVAGTAAAAAGAGAAVSAGIDALT